MRTYKKKTYRGNVPSQFMELVAKRDLVNKESFRSVAYKLYIILLYSYGSFAVHVFKLAFRFKIHAIMPMLTTVL